MNFRIVWPDFNIDSEWSQTLIKAKQVNGPEYWPTLRKVIDHDTQTLPLSRFRHWASAHNVPLITQYKTSRFIGNALHAAHSDKRWYDALVENWVGVISDQREYLRVVDDFDTSMQRIQDLSHFATCGFTIEQIKSYKSIVEIGGGYGDMCSVTHSLGFTGKYTIYDFPEIHQIQKYYLENNGITAEYATDPDQLEEADLVIATWSLSEIPFELRDRIMDKIQGSKNWLLLFQNKIFGIIEDNQTWFFRRFKDRNVMTLKHNENPFDGENLYLYAHDGI